MNDSNLKFETIWKPFAVAATLCFLYANVLLKLGFDWWTDENYSHGLLVPFVIGFIIWLEFDELKKAVSNPQNLFGGSLILFALLMLFGGTLGAELFMQRISLVVMLAGIVVYFWGAKLLQILLVPFGLLLFSIPIPQIIFNKIAFPLQLWASQMAVWGIRLLDFASVRKGNIIEILPKGSKQIILLEVVEACSGIRSLMTLMTIALILAYFTHDRKNKPRGWIELIKSFDFWRTLFLISMAIPIAIVTNAGRVTATGLLTYNYGQKAMEGFLHSSAGWIVYVVALILLILINFIIMSGKKMFFDKKFNGE